MKKSFAIISASFFIFTCTPVFADYSEDILNARINYCIQNDEQYTKTCDEIDRPVYNEKINIPYNFQNKKNSTHHCTCKNTVFLRYNTENITCDFKCPKDYYIEKVSACGDGSATIKLTETTTIDDINISKNKGYIDEK